MKNKNIFLAVTLIIVLTIIYSNISNNSILFYTCLFLLITVVSIRRRACGLEIVGFNNFWNEMKIMYLEKENSENNNSSNLNVKIIYGLGVVGLFFGYSYDLTSNTSWLIGLIGGLSLGLILSLIIGFLKR